MIALARSQLLHMSYEQLDELFGRSPVGAIPDGEGTGTAIVFPGTWCAPVFAWLWITLGRRQPSSPAKFSFGLMFAGLGFLVLVVPAQTAATGALVGPLWLTVTYLLHTWGELCLSPVGLSAMTKLAPVRIAGLMMGVWFLASSVGNYIGGRVSSFYESWPLPSLFGAVAAFSIVAGLVLLALVRPLRRLTQPGH